MVQGAKFGMVSPLRELALSFRTKHLVSNLREGLDVGYTLAVRREVCWLFGASACGPGKRNW